MPPDSNGPCRDFQPRLYPGGNSSPGRGGASGTLAMTRSNHPNSELCGTANVPNVVRYSSSRQLGLVLTGKPNQTQ